MSQDPTPRVLLDSGQYELVRPFQVEQWNAPPNGKEGVSVLMRLVGNLAVPCVINKNGEVMMKKSEQQNSDLAWVAPMCRLQVELGDDINYK